MTNLSTIPLGQAIRYRDGGVWHALDGKFFAVRYTRDERRKLRRRMGEDLRDLTSIDELRDDERVTWLTLAEMDRAIRLARSQPVEAP